MLVPLFVAIPGTLNAQEIQALDSGQVLSYVEPGAAPIHRVWVEGIVQFPPAQVWNVLTDFADYDRFYSGISRSEVRGRSSHLVMGYFKLDFPWPLPKRWTLNATHLDPDRYRFDWTRVQGTVKRYDGSLQLYPWHDHETRMVFKALMDPGLPFVPGWLIDFVAVDTLPAIVQGVRDDLSRTASKSSLSR